jgi:hypothetical protein
VGNPDGTDPARLCRSRHVHCIQEQDIIDGYLNMLLKEPERVGFFSLFRNRFLWMMV